MHQYFHEPTQPEEQRWSAIVPPQSALTFAVVWDADGDIVSFSGAQLEDSAEDSSLGSPLDVNETCSRFSFSGAGADNIGLRLGISHSETSSAFFSAVEHGSALPRIGATPLSERIQLGMTQTSSTLGGLDVYLKDSALGQTHIYRKRYTCLEELGDGFEFDPSTSYAKLLHAQEAYDGYDGRDSSDDEATDSGLGCEAGQVKDVFVRSMHPAEHFTTDTEYYTNAILSSRDCSTFDTDSVAWSRLDPPRTPGFNNSTFMQAPVQPKTTRRLRKRRPNSPPPSPPPPAPPRSVWCRTKCSVNDSPSLGVPLSAIFRCKPVLKYRNRRPIECEDDGSWVWVEAVVSSCRS